MAEKGFGVKEINLIGASGTPTIESPNNLNLNAVNVAISTNATIGGNLTVTGTVGIAGTLTYEDVTNIDAIGIVTARTGLKVLAGGANVVGVVTATSFTGNGANLTNVVASNITLTANNDSLVYRVPFASSNTGSAALYSDGDITFNPSSGTLSATVFSGSGASLTGIAVTEAPVTDYTITGDGGNYYFHGGGVDETAGDPDLYLIRGQKYRFNNTTGSSHPFLIRVSNGGSLYTDGVTGDDEGVQFFTVPYSAPATLVYQCEIHGGMVGNIYIRGGSSTATIANNGNDRIITGGSGGNLNGEANLQFDGTNLFMSDELRHLGDPDTKIGFDTDRINFETGGDNRLYISNSAMYVKSGYPLAFLASSGPTPNIKSGGTNNQDLLFTTGSGNPTRLQIDSSGNATINDGNLVIGTSGHGIDFSATSDTVSGVSELLDDYEEGSFTPTLKNFNGSYSIQIGRYTKVGNIVHYNVFVKINSAGDTGTPTGINMPFDNGSGMTVVGHLVGNDGWNTNLSESNLTTWMPNGSNEARFYKNSGNNLNGIRINDIGGSGEIAIAGSYRVS